MAGELSQSTFEGFRRAAIERMQAIEAQLAILSEKAGVPYERPGDEIPADVVALVQGGDQLGAIKKYREITGATLMEAQQVIDKI
jgi:ribosomal protein L7/L12